MQADDLMRLKNNRYLKTRNLLKTKQAAPKTPEVNLSNWKVRDECYFWETSFGNLTGHRHQGGKWQNSTFIYKNNNQLARAPDDSKEGEGSVSATTSSSSALPMPFQWILLPRAAQQQLIEFQADQARALHLMLVDAAESEFINYLAYDYVNLLERAEEEELRDYLSNLAQKI